MTWEGQARRLRRENSRAKRGYYETPNVDIPLNARGKGEVAPVAFDQLRPFQHAAEVWPMRAAWHPANHELDLPGMYGMECRLCKQFIWLIQDEYSEPYDYEDGITKTLTVGHIRRQHEKAVIINEAGDFQVLDIPLSDDAGS
jgi:hypothetical protein